MNMNGSIVIIDPCYIKLDDNDWEKCQYGDDMSSIGINTIVAAYVGEYDYEVIDIDTGDAIRIIFNDSGMLGIYPLDDVLEYNPNVNLNLGAVIDNYSGDIFMNNSDNGNIKFYVNGNKSFEVRRNR